MLSARFSSTGNKFWQRLVQSDPYDIRETSQSDTKVTFEHKSERLWILGDWWITFNLNPSIECELIFDDYSTAKDLGLTDHKFVVTFDDECSEYDVEDKSPATLPSTNPSDRGGNSPWGDVHGETYEEEWVVPYRFYQLKKLRMWMVKDPD